MRDRYPPHRPDQEWPGNSTSRPGISPPGDPTLRPDDPGGSSRTEGLRRLSRLTWRTTQLSAIAAAAFAVLFARSAPAHTASSQTAVKPSPAASPTHTPSPSPSPHAHAPRRGQEEEGPPGAAERAAAPGRGPAQRPAAVAHAGPPERAARTGSRAEPGPDHLQRIDRRRMRYPQMTHILTGRGLKPAVR